MRIYDESSDKCVDVIPVDGLLSHKIWLIKAVRVTTDAGLRECKDVVDAFCAAVEQLSTSREVLVRKIRQTLQDETVDLDTRVERVSVLVNKYNDLYNPF